MRSAAERRWNDALSHEFSAKPVTYGDIIAAMTSEIQEAATDAELRAPGGGYYAAGPGGIATGLPLQSDPSQQRSLVLNRMAHQISQSHLFLQSIIHL